MIELFMLFTLFVLSILVGVSVFVYYAKDLPRPEKFNERAFVESTKIYDRTGEVLLYELYGETKREVIPLSEMSDNINSFVTTISSISDQTNLLALNAAIEAARAGEQGRGFAVVADEVRTLAQRTQESTEEINSMIHKLQSGAKDAVSAMDEGIETARSSVEEADKAGESLQNITNAIGIITDLSIQVATATEEQSSVVEELNSHILNIKNMSDNTANESKNVNIQCQNLNDSAAILNKMIGNFKV